jgi:hypothetical protein
MRKEEFKRKVENLIFETGISRDKAIAIVEDQYMKEVKKRLKLEEAKCNEATKYLLGNPESKTVVIPIHEFISKDKAVAIAHSTIRVNKFYFLSQLIHGEKDTWLVASEFQIAHNEALNILENLNTSKYSNEEIEVIVTEHVPFDLR